MSNYLKKLLAKVGYWINIEKISYNKKLNLTQKSINIIKNNLKTLVIIIRENLILIHQYKI